MNKIFNCHGQKIEAPTFDAAYAIRFKCTVAEAIADRDEPLTGGQIKHRFVAATGRQPTDAEMKIMHPENIEDVEDFDRSNYFRG